ncbi:hypothetical protein TNCV_240621 [Trichonephila clavipes]|nr:hypothetical protein TNCV_240621 [Trichonephila clavipes]
MLESYITRACKDSGSRLTKRVIRVVARPVYIGCALFTIYVASVWVAPSGIQSTVPLFQIYKKSEEEDFKRLSKLAKQS